MFRLCLHNPPALFAVNISAGIQCCRGLAREREREGCVHRHLEYILELPFCPYILSSCASADERPLRAAI